MKPDTGDLNKSLINIEKILLERSQSKVVRLPEWPETKRATPNSFLRSALFSTADCKKERVYLKDVMLASQQGLSVQYTGEQLNQEDLTLWETLVHMVKEHNLGEVYDLTAYEILKFMNLSDGGANYDWLEKGILRLVATTVIIRHNDIKFAGHLIDLFVIDEKTSHYKIRLGREMIKLYNQSTWIDAGQRYQLQKKSLALYLHGYFSSHETPYPIKVATLHDLSGSKIKAIWKFKQNLVNALEELIFIGFLEHYRIDNDLVHVKRK
jgi:hypothetical protein